MFMRIAACPTEMKIAGLKSVAKNLARHGVATARELIGAPERYCIRGAYRHRSEICYFDDTPYRDEYQKEVYERAARIAREVSAGLVYDVGCGSGFKLMKYLGEYQTVGFDVPETLPFLKATYPGRSWRAVPFSARDIPPADVVICSDVIEHVLDPDDLMGFLLSITNKYLVLSTPDRMREYSRFSPFQLGPPHTDHHVREWSFEEFGRYVGRHMNVTEHVHSNPIHATQMIVAAVVKS